MEKSNTHPIDEYLSNGSWRIKENANHIFCVGHMMNYLTTKYIYDYWINNVFTPEIKEYHESGRIHIHDLSRYTPYSYYGKECIFIKHDNKLKYVSFKELYDNLKEEEVILNENDEAYAKLPIDLYVMDENNKYTKVTQVTRKKKTNDFVFLKDINGNSIIVTDNHPIITSQKEEIVAENIISEKHSWNTTYSIPDCMKIKELFITDLLSEQNIKHNGELCNKENKYHDGLVSLFFHQSCMNNRLLLTKELGYVIGIIIAEGHISESSITIKNKNTDIINKLKDFFVNNHILFSLSCNDNLYSINIQNKVFKELIRKFVSKTQTQQKQLLPEFINYNKDFLAGICGGIIDGEGTKSSNYSVTTRMTTRVLINQICFILKQLGYYVKDYKPYFNNQSVTGFKSNFTMFGFTLPFFENSYDLGSVRFVFNNLPKLEDIDKYYKYNINKQNDTCLIIDNRKVTIIEETEVYDITTETKTFYCNNILSHNCVGFSTSEVIKKGLKGPKGRIDSVPPKHLSSAINQLTNFVGVISQEFAGAIALNDFSLYLAPFVHYDKLEYKQVKQEIQQFIFHMNQPNRWAGECPFTNITVSLTVPEELKNSKVIIGGIEKEKTYSEFTNEMNMINEALLDVLNEGDANGTPMTFPVITIGVTPDFPWESEIAKKVFQVTAKYGTPFFENFYPGTGRSTADGRSMCPMTGDTRVVVRNKKNGIRITEINQLYKESSEYEVWTPTGWYNGKVNKQIKQDIYEITLSNGFKVKLGENHLQPIRGEKTIKVKDMLDIKEPIWIPFSNSSWNNETKGCYDWYSGFVIGAFLGDGTLSEDNIIYSLAKNEKDDDTERDIRHFFEGLGYTVTRTIEDELRTVRINGKLSEFIQRYVNGKSADTKEMTNKVFNTSFSFRRGIIDGLRASDGSKEKKRIYTSSKKLSVNICEILASLGEKWMQTYVDTRIVEEKHKLPGQKSNIRKPLYRIDFPERLSYGNYYSWGMENGICYNYFRVTDIKKIENSLELYCFEIDNDEKLFTLASGMITHNCRLKIDTSEIKKHTGGIFGHGDSMGSVAVATINLNRIGYEAEGEENYFQILDKTMEICREVLEKRRTEILKAYDVGMYPYTKFYLKNYKTFFSTIGVIGGNESMMNFMGKDMMDPEAIEFMNKVLDFMSEKCLKFQKETGNLYNLEAVPGEGAMYSLARKDKEAYSDIYLSGKEEPYLSNSTQPSVKEDSFLDIVKTQENLQTKYTGGTTLNIYLGEKMTSYKQAKNLVKTLVEKTKLPYFSITPTYSICKEHGYLDGEQYLCSTCNKKTETFSRVVGYLKPRQQYNKGKAEEFRERKYYDIKDIEKLDNKESTETGEVELQQAKI